MDKKLTFVVFVVISGALLMSGCIGGNEDIEKSNFKKVPTGSGETESEKKTGDATAEENKTTETIKPPEENKTAETIKPPEENRTAEAANPPEENKTANKTLETANTPEANDSGTEWCTLIDPAAKIKLQTVNGTKINMCCTENAGGNLRITFSNVRCVSRDGKTELRDNFQINNDGSGVKREKMEKWQADGKSCRRVTDANGIVTEEKCTII